MDVAPSGVLPRGVSDVRALCERKVRQFLTGAFFKAPHLAPHGGPFHSAALQEFRSCYERRQISVRSCAKLAGRCAFHEVWKLISGRW